VTGYSAPDVTIHHRNVLDTPWPIESGSVQCCVTSPPYFGLRSYGVDGQLGLEPTPAEFVVNLVTVFREVWRVLRPDGTAWCNLGDSYNAGRDGGWPGGKAQWTDERYQGRSGANVPGLKPKDLMGMPWRLAFALQEDGWYLRSDIIWHKRSCLGHSVRVYAKTQKGEMPMTVGEMVRLDPSTVKLWSGERWVQVTGFYPSSDARGLELSFRNGQRIPCTTDHIWPTERGEVTAGELRIGDRLVGACLPEPSDPQRPDAIPDSDGEVVGLYIAEGCMDGRAIKFNISKTEDDLTDAIKLFAKRYASACSIFDTKGGARVVTVQGGASEAVIHTYISNGDAKHKHLTTAAWQRSNAFLSNVLTGYLKGDGHWDATVNRWRLNFARNDKLADDLRTICARLGHSIRLRRCWHTSQTGKFYGWRGEIYLDPSRRKSHDWEIVGIQRAKGDRFYDVSVEDPHLFSLACGLLTHNCMPESVTDRPTSAHEHIFLLAKQPTYFYDSDAVRQQSDPEQEAHNRRYAREYAATTLGAEHRQPGNVNSVGIHSRPGPGGANLRNVWSLGPEPTKDSHFAVFPSEIPRRAILAGTSEHGCCAVPGCGAPWERVTEKGEPDKVTTRGRQAWAAVTGQRDSSGGLPHRETTTTGFRPTCVHTDAPTRPCLVLDPFMGSGTTALVARQLGRHAVGLELNESYIRIAEKRLGKQTPSFFSLAEVR
jgi:hypothetical protein